MSGRRAGEGLHGRGCDFVDLRVGVALTRGVAQLQRHLREQRVQRRVERMGHVEILAFLAQVGRPEPHREQHALQRADDLRKRLARRQVAPARFERAPLLLAPRAAHGLERLNDVVDFECGHADFSP